MMSESHSLKKLLFWLGVLLIVLFVSTEAWAQAGGGRRSLDFFDVWRLPRIWMSAIFCAIGLVLLVKGRVAQRLRLAVLAIVFFVFSVLSLLPLGSFASGMGLHPSPVCVVTRPFQFLDAGKQIPVLFLSIFGSVVILTAIGNKLYCGWVCPVGAIQEIVHRIRLPKKFKLVLPFGLTNPIRIGLFVLFMLIVFTTSYNIYDYFNPFDFLHWGFQTSLIVIFGVTVIAGLFIFRPFCYLVCPLGLFTWFFEHVSLVRVRVKKGVCTDCDICVQESHCPAVRAILEEKVSRPDCHACGRCIELCSEKALSFRW